MLRLSMLEPAPVRTAIIYHFCPFLGGIFQRTQTEPCCMDCNLNVSGGRREKIRIEGFESEV